MAKFGNIIEIDIPTVLFFTTWLMQNEADSPYYFIREIATSYQDDIKVIIIEAEKNEDLCKALNIKIFPTVIIYKSGEMKWRGAGNEITHEKIKLNIDSLI